MEWRRFVTYLWNDPRIRPVSVAICYFVVQHRTRSILDDKIGQLFEYRSADFWG